jgi:hypothetical protein
VPAVDALLDEDDEDVEDDEDDDEEDVDDDPAGVELEPLSLVAGLSLLASDFVLSPEEERLSVR